MTEAAEGFAFMEGSRITHAVLFWALLLCIVVVTCHSQLSCIQVSSVSCVDFLQSFITHTHTHTHADSLSHMHTHTHIHTHKHAHSLSPFHSLSLSLTHTHTPILSLSCTHTHTWICIHHNHPPHWF